MTPRGIIYLRPISGLEEYLLKGVSYEQSTLQNGSEVERLKILFQDALDSSSIYQLQLPYPGVLASSFMKRLPNIPLGVPLEIIVFPDKETKNPVLLFKANDEYVKVAFTKDDPKGMPEGKQSAVTKSGTFQSKTTGCLKTP